MPRRSANRDLVVRCGGGHKVRLDAGRRVLAGAVCPLCRTPVDPTRLIRLRALVSNLRRPASDHLVDRALWVAVALATGGSVLAAVVLHAFADVWWPATLILFGPRWVLLLPIPVLAAVAAVRDRLLLLPLALAAWVGVGPIMGFQTGWRSHLPGRAAHPPITVTTFNVQGGWPLLNEGIEPLMRAWGADVAAFQECGSYALSVALRDLEGWYTWWIEGVCFVSRFEILEVRAMPREMLASVGGSGLVVSFLLDGPAEPFWVTNVHLETPGDALRQIRAGAIMSGIESLRQVSLLREIEHRRAQRFAAALGGPSIVLGDFNAPPESRVYRSEWGGWTNAFSVAGLGLGGTRLSGWIRARIDHVLVDDAWEVRSARVEPPVGSDHLPVTATVVPR